MVRANVLNVTGTNSWTGVAAFGTFFQGAPRTYLLSMAVDPGAGPVGPEGAPHSPRGRDPG